MRLSVATACFLTNHIFKYEKRGCPLRQPVFSYIIFPDEKDADVRCEHVLSLLQETEISRTNVICNPCTQSQSIDDSVSVAVVRRGYRT